MARSTMKNWMASIRSHYRTRHGMAAIPADPDFDNDNAFTWSDSGDTTSIEGIRVDTDGRVRVDRQTLLGAVLPVTFKLDANGGLATQPFFTAPFPMVIRGISEVHAVAGNDAGAVTSYIEKLTGTTAPGSGTAVMTGTFNMKGTANTVQDATLLAVKGDGSPNAGIVLAAGDRLGIVFTGTLTTLSGVVVTLYCTPGFKAVCPNYSMNAAASMATQYFFQANRDLVISAVRFSCSAAETATGTATLDVTKDTSTNAPGAGTSVLAATVNLKTVTANTVSSLSLAASAATLKMAAGDRLSVKFAGTASLTALAGVVVTVTCQAVGGTGYIGEVNVQFGLLANGSQASQALFVADRDYEVAEVSEIHSTAGTDGGTVTVDFGIAKGTTAPGSATTVLTGALNAKSTAATTQYGTLVAGRHSKMLSKGDRLAIIYAGTLTALAGETATITLLPR